MESAVFCGQKSNIFEKPELNRLRLLLGINLFLIITDFLMPQYFGIHIGWDITCTRFANIFLTFYSLINYKVFNGFTKTFLRCSVSIPLVLYLVVSLYTMIFRVDINAFMLVFLEILTFYMLVFAIRYVIGVKRSIKIIIGCSYFLGVYGLIEFAAGHSLYLQFLKTVPTAVANCYRSGYYRIMGPCGHPLGYGLLLMLLIAVACVDYKKNDIYLFQRPILFSLLFINVFLTGSRSSQGIAVLEIFMLFLFSSPQSKKKSLFWGGVIVVCVGVFLLIGYRSKLGRYFMMQITMVIDQILDTTFSEKYGADVTTLHNSEEYRKFLPKVFTLDWLNPFIGRGLKRGFGAEFPDESGNMVYLQSIDNFYVSQYIKYAYPGLITYCLFVLTAVISMIRGIAKYKSSIMKGIFVGFCVYFFNLWWLDSLQTQKFVYVLLAVFYATKMVFQDNDGVLFES